MKDLCPESVAQNLLYCSLLACFTISSLIYLYKVLNSGLVTGYCGAAAWRAGCKVCVKTARWQWRGVLRRPAGTICHLHN